jgi:cAMP-dependent protein kinase regulator
MISRSNFDDLGSRQAATHQEADLERKSFPAGSFLIRQDELGECAWLIQSGKLEVVRIQPDSGEVRKLSILGPGALVGEMALIDRGPRSAHVRCVTDVTTVEVTRADFVKMMQQGKPLATYLLKSLVGAIRGAYGLSAPSEADPKAAEIRSERSSQSILDRRVYRADYVFFKEGDRGDIAYLIQSGSVSIRKGDKELVALGSGRIFGELAMLRNEPRGATAVAATAATCELIRKVDFDEAIATMPPILRTMTQSYVERLASKR